LSHITENVITGQSSPKKKKEGHRSTTIQDTFRFKKGKEINPHSSARIKEIDNTKSPSIQDLKLEQEYYAKSINNFLIKKPLLEDKRYSGQLHSKVQIK